jgi:predicted transcriptional regulator
MMVQEDFDTLLEFFKVMSHENRLKIVGILAERECGVEELATLLDLKAPTVSHHLGKLSNLGLVQMRREGNDHLYRLNADGLHGLARRMFASLESGRVAELVDGVEYEAWERKVLNTFVDGDRVNAIPTGYKKRLALLKWMADHFEMDREYTELEVNEIIERHHGDYCLFRREMVETGLMARKDGIYWRLEWEMPELD